MVVDEQEEARQAEKLGSVSESNLVLRRGFSKRLIWWLVECVMIVLLWKCSRK